MTIFESKEVTLIALSDAPHHLPKRQGRKVHYSTIFRWATKGVGGRVLPSVKIGGIRYTTIEALAAFVDHSALALPSGMATVDVSAVNRSLDDAGL